eukprot:6581825-Pyramimonas_sp.AAC.1
MGSAWGDQGARDGSKKASDTPRASNMAQDNRRWLNAVSNMLKDAPNTAPRLFQVPSEPPKIPRRGQRPSNTQGL